MNARLLRFNLSTGPCVVNFDNVAAVLSAPEGGLTIVCNAFTLTDRGPLPLSLTVSLKDAADVRKQIESFERSAFIAGFPRD